MKVKKESYAPAGMVRFTMNIDAKLHRKLRLAVISRGMTMAAIVLDALKAKGIK